MDRRRFLKNITGATVLFMISPLERLVASKAEGRLWDDIYRGLVAKDAPDFIQKKQEEIAINFYNRLMEKYALQKSIPAEVLEKKVGKLLPDAPYGTASGKDGYALSGWGVDGFKRSGSTANPNTDLKICEKTELTVRDAQGIGWYMVNNVTYDSDDPTKPGANIGDPTYATITAFNVVGVASPQLTHTPGSRRVDIIVGINVVPIVLSSFTASNVKDDLDDIILNWTTASEKNNYGFYIERSKDGINYETIDFIKGNRTTDNENKYKFRDPDLEPGKYFYRLKQVDFDGTFKYSPLSEIAVKAPTEFVLFQNFPNPFNPITKIKYSLPESRHVKVSVYNLLGQEVRKLIDQHQQPGTHTVEFDGSLLPSGIYFYRLQTNDLNKTRRMILTK